MENNEVGSMKQFIGGHPKLPRKVLNTKLKEEEMQEKEKSTEETYEDHWNAFWNNDKSK